MLVLHDVAAGSEAVLADTGEPCAGLVVGKRWDDGAFATLFLDADSSQAPRSIWVFDLDEGTRRRIEPPMQRTLNVVWHGDHLEADATLPPPGPRGLGTRLLERLGLKSAPQPSEHWQLDRGAWRRIEEPGIHAMSSTVPSQPPSAWHADPLPARATPPPAIDAALQEIAPIGWDALALGSGTVFVARTGEHGYVAFEGPVAAPGVERVAHSSAALTARGRLLLIADEACGTDARLYDVAARTLLWSAGPETSFVQFWPFEIPAD